MKNTATAEEIKQFCPLQCNKHHPNSTHIFELDNHKYGIITNQEISTQCKGKTNKINNPTIGILQVEIPCGCKLIDGNQFIEPKFPCSAMTNEIPQIHHLIHAAFLKTNSTIIADDTMYNDLDEIINHKWSETIPHHTLTTTPIATEYELYEQQNMNMTRNC